MSPKDKINIAIDGYSASGKSTLAKLLANKLGYTYIDSGAMYRAVTLFALERGIIKEGNIYKPSLLEILPQLNIEFKKESKNYAETFLNEINVEKKIRTLEIAKYVSPISAIKEVREKLVSLQQSMGEKKGVVMDGRDIGSTVFPDAELKFFMISDIDVRVERRHQELTQRGDKISKTEVKENLRKRDYIDSNREESPLIQVEDAIVIDNSEVEMDELLIKLGKIAEDKITYLNQKVS